MAIGGFFLQRLSAGVSWEEAGGKRAQRMEKSEESTNLATRINFCGLTCTTPMRDHVHVLASA